MNKAYLPCILLLSVLFLAVPPSLHPQQQGGSHPFTWKYPPQMVRAGEHFSFIYHQDPASEATVLRIFINGGKKAEPEGEKGLAFLTTRLCLEIPNHSSILELNELGASFFVAVAGDYSMITIKCLSKNLDDALDILAAIIKEPLFSSIRLGHVKKSMEHRRKRIKDDAEQRLKEECYTALFGPHGYGGPVNGTEKPDSLKKLKKKKVSMFYRRFFNLANMTFAISSNLDRETVKGIMGKHFASMAPGKKQGGGPPPSLEEPPAPLPPEQRSLFFKKEQKQTLTALVFRLPPLSPDNYVLAFMLEQLLGDGIGSRLWSLRSEKHLAYTIDADAVRMKDAGMLTVYLKTDKSKKEMALKELKAIMRELFRSGVSQKEFEAARVGTRALFLRQNETKERRTYFLGYFQAMGLGLSFFNDFVSHVERITFAQLNTYIEKVLNPENMYQITIGPEE